MARFLLKRTMYNKGVFQYGGQILIGIIFLFLVSFLLIYSKNKIVVSASELSEETMIKLDSDSLLLNFLKKEVDNPNADNVADLLRLYYLTDDQKIINEIKDIAKEHFSNSHLESETASWSLIIYRTRDDTISKQIDGKFSTGLRSKLFVAYEEIPLSKDFVAGNLGLELYYVKKY